MIHAQNARRSPLSVVLPAMVASVLVVIQILAVAPARAATVVRADRMLDVRTGTIVPGAAVAVDGEHITYAGPAAGFAVSPADTVVDLGDVTLLPGLMDLHTHLTIGSTKPRRRGSFSIGTQADTTLRAAHNARATLYAGFTTVRELGAWYFIDVALGQAVDKGLAVGPRVVPSGYQISMTGGHGDDLGWPPGVFETGPEQGVADGRAALLHAVRYQLKHGARVIKLMATAGVLSLESTPDARQFSDEELRTVVEEAHRDQVKVAAHAHGLAGILAAVRAGVDSIEHGSQADEEACRMMKERGTYLVPTAWINTGGGVDRSALPPEVAAKGRAISAQAKESLRLAIREGVPIAYGTDAGVYPHGLNANDFPVLVDAGMSPLDAIRSATLRAADLLGVDDRGALEPGLLADVIAVPGNPLDDVTVLQHVTFVMQGGKVFRHGLLEGDADGIALEVLTEK